MPGIYIHIPFCEKKCVYCDFYSIEKTSHIDDFLDMLCEEIRMTAVTIVPTENFSTLFLGGGTPSLLTPAQVERIFNVLHRHFSFTPDAEITMECNPGTVDEGKLHGYKSLGVNRLSFGVQSFHADELAFLGRIHNAEQARQCVSKAQTAGFDNINIDLMFALPMHTRERWEYTLREAIALQTQHISAYSLIYEEGTPLFSQLIHKQVHPLDEEIDAELSLFTSDFLSAYGFVQYEVSNYAKPIGNASNQTCTLAQDLYVSKHNLNYWRRGEYVSFGPSAHSYWNGERRWNYSNLSAYIEALRDGRFPTAGSEHITQEQALTEYISLGLRSDGIRLLRFRELFNFDFVSRFLPSIESYVNEGLLRVTDDRVYCTTKGYLWCDAMTLEFMRDN
jgi:oxygen-independent coproporphyrinogen-3 oxidase